MKYSICIPNYNYGRYLGDTIASVLRQAHRDLEVLVSDNASSDNSVEVVRSFEDPRLRLWINAVNVGFAGNLDKVAMHADGDRMILLSSDDLMNDGALSVYEEFWSALGGNPDRAILTSTCHVIDSNGKRTGTLGPMEDLWLPVDRAPHLDALAGGPVYSVPADVLLKRCLKVMKNPFNFAATCYPRKLYAAVEGYGGGRLTNPDKWFHWKLLTVAEVAYFIDRPLFSYRWHAANQSAQELGPGTLKYLVDEYVATLEFETAALDRLQLTRQDLIGSFIEQVIVNHGLATLGRGNRVRARRILNFGKSVYPDDLKKNKKSWILSLLLSLGPVGRGLASWAYRRHLQESVPVQVA
jgi:glycosyltransferase involved in cell wall biosynthesis